MAFDISANGAVIVGVSHVAGGARAVRWTAAGIEELGSLSSEPHHSYAQAVSADGSTIAGYCTTAAGTEGFVWTAAAGIFSIGDLPGGALSCIPDCVSADGQWVGGRGTSDAGQQAILWSAATGLETLDPLATGELPWRIHDLGIDGSRAYGSVLQGEELVGFEWNRGLGGSLLPEPPIAEFTSAVRTDLENSLVGINSYFSGTAEPYVLFSGSGQLLRLEDHLFSLGVPSLNGLSLISISDLSVDGKSIAGYAINANGNYEGWIARLATTGPAPIGTTYCSAQAPNSSGTVAQIQATGFETAAINSVTLVASQMPPGEFGFFLNSLEEGFVPMPGGSAGNLCLGGQIGRYSTDLFSTGAGSASLLLDLGSTPTPAGMATIGAGRTWRFQAWFRDTAAGSGVSNFTSGVSIAFN